MHTLTFHGHESTQVTFDSTTGTGTDPIDYTPVPAPTIWLFAVDPSPGSGYLVFSGEYSAGTGTTINFARFNPFDRIAGHYWRDYNVEWPVHWQRMVELPGSVDEDGFTVRTISDHWHIYAHGAHWVSFSVHGMSRDLDRHGEIWLARVDQKEVVIEVEEPGGLTKTLTYTSFIRHEPIQLGCVLDVGWAAGGLELPTDCFTNDHFLVATEDGVAVGVFKGYASSSDGGATPTGHYILNYNMSSGAVTSPGSIFSSSFR